MVKGNSPHVAVARSVVIAKMIAGAFHTQWWFRNGTFQRHSKTSLKPLRETPVGYPPIPLPTDACALPPSSKVSRGPPD